MAIILILFLLAVFGVILLFLQIETGKYLVYVSVPLGAIITIFASIASALEKIDRDHS